MTTGILPTPLLLVTVTVALGLFEGVAQIPRLDVSWLEYNLLRDSVPEWSKVGAIYLCPSSPRNPYVLTPDEPPNSWWTLNFSLFASQKYIDEMLLNRALSAHPSKSLAIYFPQFLADNDALGTKYLEELEEVVVFFYEKGFHILLFVGLAGDITTCPVFL